MTSIGSSDPAPLGYPLVEADRVLTRVLVFTIMAVFVGGVFAVLVIGFGALVGYGGGSDVALSVVATAVVAVAFQPARRRTERRVNRVLFGRRATPYEILSDFTRRVAATSDGLVDDAARSLAEGTGAQRVVVSIAGQPRHSVVVFDDGDTPTDSVSFPIVDGELTLGSLDLYLPADRRPRPPTSTSQRHRLIGGRFGLKISRALPFPSSRTARRWGLCRSSPAEV